MKNSVNNRTTWQYDALARVTQETNQLSKTRTFKYDAVGNLTECVDRLGQKIEWVYGVIEGKANRVWAARACESESQNDAATAWKATICR